jgi:hypothetical protein
MSAFARLAILSLSRPTPCSSRSRFTTSQHDDDVSLTPHTSLSATIGPLEPAPAAAEPVRPQKAAWPETIWSRARAAVWL